MRRLDDAGPMPAARRELAAERRVDRSNAPGSSGCRPSRRAIAALAFGAAMQFLRALRKRRPIESASMALADRRALVTGLPASALGLAVRTSRSGEEGAASVHGRAAAIEVEHAGRRELASRRTLELGEDL